MKPCTLYETQSLFRCLMNAMAEPGTVFTAPVPDEGNEMPLVLRICNTLIDHEVSFAVLGKEVNEAFINSVALVTGSEYVDAACAQFVIICGGNSDGALKHVSLGTLEYPEKGATVIYLVQDLAATDGVVMTLTGPGIASARTATIDGVARGELALIRALNSEYPLGIDTFFCDADKVVALPRTTRMAFCEEK